MKKLAFAITAFIVLFTFASCGNNNGDTNGNTVSDDIGNAAEDVTDGIENGVEDITDGTMFDTNNNYNVDDYTANGTQTK